MFIWQGRKGKRHLAKKISNGHGNSRCKNEVGVARTLIAKPDKIVAVAETKGPLILARTRNFCQLNLLSGFVYSVEVDCQIIRSDTMSEYKPEEYGVLILAFSTAAASDGFWLRDVQIEKIRRRYLERVRWQSMDSHR